MQVLLSQKNQLSDALKPANVHIRPRCLAAASAIASLSSSPLWLLFMIYEARWQASWPEIVRDVADA